MTLLEWLLAAQFFWNPAPTVDHSRYESIAKDIVSVVYDNEEKALFKGEYGKAKTALLIDAIASLESFYREDVDNGTKRGGLGEVCIMQILLPYPSARIVLNEDTYTYSDNEGWSYSDLIADRKKCIRAGLHKVRESFRACHNLSLYTSGTCLENEPKAKFRQWRAENWFNKHPLQL